MAPRTASTAVAIATVSLLLRFIADPFLARISILAPGLGTAYHAPNSWSSEAQFFLRTLLSRLPSAKFHLPEKPETGNCFFAVTWELFPASGRIPIHAHAARHHWPDAAHPLGAQA